MALSPSPERDPFAIDWKVSRLENGNQSSFCYDAWQEVWQCFGGILLGDGYWVGELEAGWPIDYSGKLRPGGLDPMPQWIGVPSEGWAQIGLPQSVNVREADIQVSDGGRVLSMYNASQYGENWLNSVGYWFDSAYQNQYDVGLPDDASYTEELYPWHGYWFEFYGSNRALIVPPGTW